MTPRDRTTRRPPLDAEALNRFALAYVGRYATTRAKLTAYLQRKVRERGWAGEGVAPVEAIVSRCVDAGYVNDSAFAAARANALTRRGYGMRRIGAVLAVAGIDSELVIDLTHDDEAAFAAAEAFARRRRIGAFAADAPDEATRRRTLAAMLRAGHDFALSRRFAAAVPGEIPERESVEPPPP